VCPGGQEISIDCCTAGAQQQRRHSSKCEQCHVYSWPRKLTTDLFSSLLCPVVSGYDVAVLELYHDSTDEMVVDGYPGAGEYVRPIRYDAPTYEELDAIIDRADRCEQYIRYKCYQSKLLSDSGM